MTDRPADYGTPAEALRLMKEPMPEGFTWEFDISLAHKPCGTVGCAAGELALKCGQSRSVMGFVQERFGFPTGAYSAIFWNDVGWDGFPFYRKSNVFVTRDDVIRALERYVTTGKLDGGE